jgi:hypothetical protein
VGVILDVIEAALAGAQPVGQVFAGGMAYPEDMQEIHFQDNRYLYTPGTTAAMRTTLRELLDAPLPSALRARTDRVVFTTLANIDDAYWQREYNEPDFVSLASAGRGDVTVYRGRSIGRGDLAHEMAHNLAIAVYKSTDPPAFSDFAAAAASGEPPVSAYGKKHLREDFAEAVQLYVENPDKLRAIAPRRYAVIARLMREVGYGG